MPTSSLREPLKPTYKIERARIEEHDRLMNDAAREHSVVVWHICPDCYQPKSKHVLVRGELKCKTRL